MDIVWSRPLPEVVEPSSVAVRVDAAGRWFVSILVDENIEQLPPSSQSVGIDVGITQLATLSTGEKVANPKTFNKFYRRLRNAQKKLSRKKKASRNRDKARRKVAKIHNRIKDSRQDHLHKVTNQLVRENQVISS